MSNIKIVNLVITSNLNHKLNLKDIASKVYNTEYNPEQFPGLVIRMKEPKTSSLLFSSGKIVCAGAKSVVNANIAVNNIIKILKKIGIKIKIKPVLKIQNLVGSGELDFNLNLDVLATALKNIEYEPEQFPGLVYKIKSPYSSNFLLFSNGKIVCTGTKSKKEMTESVKQLIKNLKKIKKGITKK